MAVFQGHSQRSRCGIILCDHVGYLPRRHISFLQVFQEFLRYPGKMRFMAFLVFFGNYHFPAFGIFLQFHTGEFGLYVFELFGEYVGKGAVFFSYGLYIQSRFVLLLCTLADDEVGLCTAHDGIMGITGALGRFVIPFHRYFGVHIFYFVIDLTIRKNGQYAILADIFFEMNPVW
jgi:hypothetical protein